MNLWDFRNELAAAAEAGLPNHNAYPFLADRVEPPCFIAGFGRTSFDESYKRGAMVNLECFLVVSRVDDKSGWRKLADYQSRTESTDNETADLFLAPILEQATYDNADWVHVSGFEETALEISGVEYLAVKLDLIAKKG